jgi:hypothetical protein
MKVGDFVQVLGENNVEWYGEVVGLSGSTLDVYFIEPSAQPGGVWKYSEEWHTIPKESVQVHVSTVGVVAGLKQLGFRPLDESTFVKLSEEHLSVNIPVGMPLPDTDTDFVGIHPEMQDFIIPDEEGEAFSFAPPTSSFVKETHEAVHAFNDWQPEDSSGEKIKIFIDTMDVKECIKEDNRNQVAMSYIRPPLK